MRLIFKPFFLWGALLSPGYALRAAQRLMCPLSMQFKSAIEYLKRFSKKRRGDRGGRSPSVTIFAIIDRARAIPLILKSTQRARAQRLASLGAGRVALCVITRCNTIRPGWTGHAERGTALVARAACESQDCLTPRSSLASCICEHDGRRFVPRRRLNGSGCVRKERVRRTRLHMFAQFDISCAQSTRK